MGPDGHPAGIQDHRPGRPRREGPCAGTSQTCHQCGHRDPAARDGIRFSCANPTCGWTGHADTNAAINIRNAAGTVVSGRGDLGAARSAKRQPPRAA
ncbi:zinc ribbon domain-containing protein [Nonomuraea fuscirosea]|uniref:zinc ribbon domain-containing protein n=1 Tax=Nonomuraea fuscirosea TaxID=1291556 RepID=UPI00348AF29C